MRFELVNRYYGTKKVAPSEKAKDRILAECRKDPKDGLPVWQVSKELPDEVAPSREGELLTELEALKAELAQLKAEEKPAPKKKAAPKKAVKKGDLEA